MIIDEFYQEIKDIDFGSEIMVEIDGYKYPVAFITTNECEVILNLGENKEHITGY